MKENNYDVIEAHQILHEAVGEIVGKYKSINYDYMIAIQEHCRDKIELAKLRLESQGATPYEKVWETLGRKKPEQFAFPDLTT